MKLLVVLGLLLPTVLYAEASRDGVLVAEAELAPLIMPSAGIVDFSTFFKSSSRSPIGLVELVQMTSGIAAPKVASSTTISEEGYGVHIKLPEVSRESRFIVRALSEERGGHRTLLASREIVVLPEADAKRVRELLQSQGVVCQPQGTGKNSRLVDMVFKITK